MFDKLRRAPYFFPNDDTSIHLPEKYFLKKYDM